MDARTSVVEGGYRADGVGSVETHDGLRLAVWRSPARSPTPRGRVILIHGYAEHAGRYREVVTALTGAGHECHAFDLWGHGRSGGPRGHVLRFADYLDDLDRVIRLVVDPPALPLAVVGHSLGGLIALEHVRRRPGPFDLLVASSPFLAPAFRRPLLVEALGRLGARLRPSATVESRLDAGWLSHDAAVTRAYAADPLVFRTVTLGWWREVRHAQEALRRGAALIRLPALFLIGDGDPVADPHRSVAIFERMGSADKRLERYPGFLHEVFNEIGRERVLQDLLAWLDGRLPQPRG
jgi:lysophospholipase